jgi:hypothetical protein
VKSQYASILESYKNGSMSMEDADLCITLLCRRSTGKKGGRPKDPPLGEWPGFDEFWNNYPRKVAKAIAQKAWNKNKPPLDKVLTALAWQSRQQQWVEAGHFIPHPSTYINAQRWEDERPAQGAVVATGGSHTKLFPIHRKGS